MQQFTAVTGASRRKSERVVAYRDTHPPAPAYLSVDTVDNTMEIAA